MEQDTVIQKTITFVKETLAEAEGGHDWWHIYRVWNNAKFIANGESGVNMLVIELGALLHDIADSKFHNGDEEIGPATARSFLESLKVSEDVICEVENIIRHVSFKGSLAGQSWMSPELAVVQDADRLDAIGAIGIARTFNYGGHVGRSLYDPNVKPNLTMTKEEYKRGDNPTINHFYEKLLLLKDLMNTESGRAAAQSRHDFMELFLEKFYSEWEGKS